MYLLYLMTFITKFIVGNLEFLLLIDNIEIILN
jgi:hypothetical protein